MNKLELYTIILGDMRETYISKNNDYGDSFGKSIDKYGLISALTRISDKFNRLENLMLNDKIYVTEETIKDTLLDLANYCIMTIIELQRKEKEINYKEIIDNLTQTIKEHENSLKEYNNELSQVYNELEEYKRKVGK